jgi:hypothetical protein
MKRKIRRKDPKDAVFLNRFSSHYEYSIPAGAQPWAKLHIGINTTVQIY